MNLSVTRGDSEAFSLPTSVDCTAAVALILTAKRSLSDPDGMSVFQKYLGYGLTIDSAAAITMNLVPADTAGLEGRMTLYWDAQAQWANGDIKTVSSGQLLVKADATQGLSVSVPVNTTGGGATIVAPIGPYPAGATWSFSLTNIYDRDGAPVLSLSGWGAVFVISTLAGAAVITRTTAAGHITTAAGPSYVWTVPSGISGIPPGQYNYAMTLTDAGGQVAIPVMGPMTVV